MAHERRLPRRRGPIVATAGPSPILAIETSCDDTCAAVVTREGDVLSNVISSQARLHERYGGVVPEVASRHHLELVNAVAGEALAEAGAGLEDMGAVAVTSGPGLIGALLIGLSTAKALAAAARLPFIPVDHMHGHVAANFLAPDPFEPPFLCLLASGGHTLLAEVDDHTGYRVLGSTRDDAAGEALDKAARLMGMGYPGGAEIDRLAREGDPGAFRFPVGMRSADSLDFSFSGLKTALVYTVRDLGPERTPARRRPRCLVPARGGGLADPEARAGARTQRGTAGRDRRRRGREFRAAGAGGGALRARGAGSPHPTGVSMYRQCRDDRLSRQVRGGGPVS